MPKLAEQLTNTWTQSKLKSLLHIDIPLIQAPMAGGPTTPELIAAVANAGGLGSLGAGYMSADDIRDAIKKIRALTNRNFSVNLFVPEKHQATKQQQENMAQKINQICAELNITLAPKDPPYAASFNEQIQVVIEEKVPVFSFTFGIPESHWIEQLKKNNTIIIGTATSLTEAKQLEAAGVDAIVAQTFEGGGHRGTFIGDVQDSLIGGFSLIPQLADNISVPLIAAGGLMDAKGLLAALLLGADGVQMGTAFLACKESGAHPEHKKLLLNALERNTVLTKVFSGKSARGIKNKFISEMETLENECLDYPIQNALTKPIRQAAAQQNNPEFMSLWTGQSAYLSQDITAAELIKQIKKDIDVLL